MISHIYFDQQFCRPSLSAESVHYQESGGQGVYTKIHDLKRSWGIFTLTYDMYSIPDRLDLYYENRLIYSTGGPVSGSKRIRLSYAGNSSLITVVVTGNPTDPGTGWQYIIERV